jgi:hypothetical protein
MLGGPRTNVSDAKIPLVGAALCRRSGRGQGDLVAEPLELVHGVTAGAFRGRGGVVAGAGVVIERSCVGHVRE